MKTIKVNVEKIKIEPGLNPRPICEVWVRQLAERMRECGYDARYPIECIQAGEEYIVVQGHHRLLAAKLAGINAIPVIIVPESEKLIRSCRASERPLSISSVYYAITRYVQSRPDTSIDDLVVAFADALAATAKIPTRPLSERGGLSSLKRAHQAFLQTASAILKSSHPDRQEVLERLMLKYKAQAFAQPDDSGWSTQAFKNWLKTGQFVSETEAKVTLPDHGQREAVEHALKELGCEYSPYKAPDIANFIAWLKMR